MTDQEILDFKVGDQTIREMTAITFLHWLAKKIDNSSAYSAQIVELTMAISAPPVGQQMEESGKVELVNKLLRAGITL